MSTATQKLLSTADRKSYDSGYIEEDKNNAEEQSNIMDNSTETQKKQHASAVIKEQTIATTTKLILLALSITNAAFLYIILADTVYIETWTDLSNCWLLFLISLTLAVSVIMIPICFCINVQSETFKKQFLTENNNELENGNDDNNITDKHPFFHKFEYLLQSTTSFVVAISLRDAADLTFKQEIIQKNNIESAAYIAYAVICTVIGVWITIYLTNKQHKYKKDIIERGVIDINKSILTHFAVKTRYISLMILTITYIMAWAWRNAIEEFVLAMYGGNKLSTMHVWIYCMIVTIFISFLVSLSDHFYCLYPREDEAQNLFSESRTVEETSKLIYDNCKFVIGFAWHSAIRITVFENSTESVVFNVLVLYWTVAILMIFISIYGTHKLTQKKIEKEIDAIGIGNWLQKTKETLSEHILLIHSCSREEDMDSDRTDNIIITYTQYEIPRLCHTFGVTIISLTIECWIIPGALFVVEAVLYSVLAIYDDIQEYSIELGYQHIATGLWLQWIFLFIILGITALIMLYLKKVMVLFKRERRALTRKINNLMTQMKLK